MNKTDVEYIVQDIIYCIAYKTTYGKPKISAMYMNWYFTQIALYFYCLKTNDTSLHVFGFLSII